MKALPQMSFGRLIVSAYLWLPAVALFTGCGGKNFKPYVHPEGSVTMVAVQYDGVTIKADPLLDPHANKVNFGMNCLEKGILPVYVSVTNSSRDTSFRIVTRDIWFAFGEDDMQQVKGGLHQTNNSAAGNGFGVAGGVIVGVSAVPGVLLLGFGMKKTDDEESIRENFVIKQFQNVTLTPGKSASGFVYFTQTNPVSPGQLPSIRIPVQNLQTQQTNVAVFSLTAQP